MEEASHSWTQTWHAGFQPTISFEKSLSNSPPVNVIGQFWISILQNFWSPGPMPRLSCLRFLRVGSSRPAFLAFGTRNLRTWFPRCENHRFKWSDTSQTSWGVLNSHANNIWMAIVLIPWGLFRMFFQCTPTFALNSAFFTISLTAHEDKYRIISASTFSAMLTPDWSIDWRILGLMFILKIALITLGAL